MLRTQQEAIAKVFPHMLDGKNAATVYLRGIPVVTYLASLEPKKPKTNDKISGLADAGMSALDRAINLTALLNQMSLNGFDASRIVPDSSGGNLTVKLGDQGSINLNSNLIASNSSGDRQQDTLEVANLMRRLMGGVAPIANPSNLGNKPAKTQKNLVARIPKVFASLSPFPRGLRVASGMASWYGAEFHGRMSASGEIFNTYGLTAAHPSLPFGTAVRVTNINNGKSVIVRINDRGPFYGGRIIDVSKGAASVLGFLGSGVAPVRVEVLSRS
jgi:rare lipoprotein A